MRSLKITLSILLGAVWALSPARAEASQESRHAQLLAAARQLEHSTDHFHHLMHRHSEFWRLSDDAHRLAEAAHEFYRTVEHRARADHLLAGFGRLTSAYQHMERVLAQSHDAHHDQHVVHDWRKVESNYATLYGHMGGRPGPRPEPPVHRIEYLRLAVAAQQFDHSADHFHRLTHRRSEYRGLAGDTHRLAVAAREFRRAVERRASADQLVVDFGRVSSAYQHLERIMRDPRLGQRHTHVVPEWRRVEESFANVHWRMTGLAYQQAEPPHHRLEQEHRLYRPPTPVYPSDRQPLWDRILSEIVRP